jgi:hypothetical protein
MSEYRAYLIGRNGHIQGYEPLNCPDDAAAVAAAKRLISAHGVEVWQDDRKVVTLGEPEVLDRRTTTEGAALSWTSSD